MIGNWSMVNRIQDGICTDAPAFQYNDTPKRVLSAGGQHSKDVYMRALDLQPAAHRKLPHVHLGRCPSKIPGISGL
ncbi:hypothetical protein SBDP1_320015 [Syntrophobacter sp. SbD1]|nr:hypothetical protein SBDP1_320015 [Syntrophobacter sp. SbD1]